jgi:hypothetical protein
MFIGSTLSVLQCHTSNPSLIFVSKAVACLNGTTRGCVRGEVANTLAYYSKQFITNVKGFTLQAPGQRHDIQHNNSQQNDIQHYNTPYMPL